MRLKRRRFYPRVLWVLVLTGGLWVSWSAAQDGPNGNTGIVGEELAIDEALLELDNELEAGSLELPDESLLDDLESLDLEDLVDESEMTLDEPPVDIDAAALTDAVDATTDDALGDRFGTEPPEPMPIAAEPLADLTIEEDTVETVSMEPPVSDETLSIDDSLETLEVEDAIEALVIDADADVPPVAEPSLGDLDLDVVDAVLPVEVADVPAAEPPADALTDLTVDIPVVDAAAVRARAAGALVEKGVPGALTDEELAIAAGLSDDEIEALHESVDTEGLGGGGEIRTGDVAEIEQMIEGLAGDQTDMPELAADALPESDMPELMLEDAVVSDLPEMAASDLPESDMPELVLDDAGVSDLPELAAGDFPESDMPELVLEDPVESDMPELTDADLAASDMPALIADDFPESDGVDFGDEDPIETDMPEVMPDLMTDEQPEPDVAEVTEEAAVEALLSDAEAGGMVDRVTDDLPPVDADTAAMDAADWGNDDAMMESLDAPEDEVLDDVEMLPALAEPDVGLDDLAVMPGVDDAPVEGSSDLEALMGEDEALPLVDEELPLLEEAMFADAPVDAVIDDGLIEELAEPDSLDDLLGSDDVVEPAADAEDEIAADMPGMADVVEQAPDKAPVLAPAAKDARWLSEGEALRRRAFMQHAEETLAAADAAFLAGDYLEAWAKYEKAQVNYDEVGDVEGVKAIRKHIAARITESKYLRALVLIKFGDLEEAQKLATDAGHEGHLKAVELVDQIKVMMQERPTPPAPVRPRYMQEDYLAKQRDIRMRMREGRELYAAGEYTEAQAAFESVLKKDPHNTEAIRWREKVSQRRYRRASEELESTRDDMMAMVRRTWNPRNYIDGEDAEPRDLAQQPTRVTQQDQRREAILSKLDEIILPELNFRQANINDVIQFIQQQSEIYDLSEDTARKGVNIILHLGSGGGQGGAAAAAPAEDEFGFFEEAPAAAAPGGGERLITFRARDISLREALKIVTEVASLKYRIEGSVVMVVPLNARDGDLVYQMYDVLPTVRERIVEFDEIFSGGGGGDDFITMDADSFDTAETDWKGFFGQMGVEWPEGSSIKYIAPIGKLMVANTAENLAVFEQRLAALNVVPSQIEIETRFVEVKQTDLNTLGLEYLLNDDWEIAEKPGGRTFATSQRIVAPATAFTKGNRYLNQVDTTAFTFATPDDIFSIASVLTNPELQIILHALEQSGNSDLLSAPKVLTQSGMEATIKVVTEFIYPSRYTITEGLPPTFNADGSLSSPGTPTVVSPASFDTREVGVILAVLPEVSPEGQLINLTLTPEVVTEPTWRNYGQAYVDATGNTQITPIEQPFFNTRSIQTSIMIYDGATVVMGGMITEQRTEVNDKIPLLGDLPIVGRLFQSRYDHSEKRNLLIFVTARLVDPAGRQIRQSDKVARELQRQAQRMASDANEEGLPGAP